MHVIKLIHNGSLPQNRLYLFSNISWQFRKNRFKTLYGVFFKMLCVEKAQKLQILHDFQFI